MGSALAGGMLLSAPGILGWIEVQVSPPSVDFMVSVAAPPHTNGVSRTIVEPPKYAVPSGATPMVGSAAVCPILTPCRVSGSPEKQPGGVSGAVHVGIAVLGTPEAPGWKTCWTELGTGTPVAASLAEPVIAAPATTNPKAAVSHAI